jgi:hypothetical protein
LTHQPRNDNNISDVSVLSSELSTTLAMEQSEPFMRSHPHSRGNSTNEMSERGSAQGQFNDKTMQSHVHPVDDRRKGTGMGWTTETCSYIIAILALGGLVATLLVHQGKPLPQWPQLVTINSIISIFSLLMRACVGVVLAEGILRDLYRRTKY